MEIANKTLFGIKHEAERYVLTSWSMMVILASLIGDSIILIGTVKYKAIKQHKVIVAVIQHMAVCDLLQTVFRVFPDTLTLLADRWIVGELLCHVEVAIIYVCSPVTMLLTSCLTTLKLIIVKKPLRVGTWTTKLGHKICAAMWILVLCWYTPILVGNMSYLRKNLYFRYREYNCDYDFDTPNIPTWHLMYILMTLLPGSIVVKYVLSSENVLKSKRTSCRF
jgi:hypothetical protein